jgi:glycosyltransferase involved in cell wall biosynthesis
LANRLGISDQIDWVGFVPLDQAQNLMDQADVFVLTSLLEGSASVVMESLSLGLPVICHDTCGMGVAIDERCGIKVAMTDPQTSITGFAEAIRRLLEQPEQVEELSAGAIQRSHELTWTSLAEKISDAYRAAVPRVD